MQFILLGYKTNAILSLFNILRYVITLKSSFNHHTNHISPSPNWPEHQPPDLSISTSAPLSEDATGAMDFNFWSEIGTDFLVKSNINNWISCSEDGGSFVTQMEGGLNCKVEKIIVPGVCEQVRPYRLVMGGGGPALFASSFYYYFETSETQRWPVADPCGMLSTNNLENIHDPSGWVYIRPEQTLDIPVHEVFDSGNPSGESYFKNKVRQRKNFSFHFF